MDAARLKAEQPALYRLLERGFREDSLPQAILLYSSPRCAFRDLVHTKDPYWSFYTYNVYCITIFSVLIPFLTIAYPMSIAILIEIECSIC